MSQNMFQPTGNESRGSNAKFLWCMIAATALVVSIVCIIAFYSLSEKGPLSQEGQLAQEDHSDPIVQPTENKKKRLDPKTRNESCGKLLDSGRSKYHSGDYAGAIQDLNKAIELGFDKSMAKRDFHTCTCYYFRGRAYRKTANYQKALDDFSKGIKLTPKDESLYKERGNTHHLLANYKEAIADYTKGIKLIPSSKGIKLFPCFRLYFDRGLACQKLGDNEKAFLDYEKAFSLAPECAIVYYRMARIQNRVESITPETLTRKIRKYLAERLVVRVSMAVLPADELDADPALFVTVLDEDKFSSEGVLFSGKMRVTDAGSLNFMARYFTDNLTNVKEFLRCKPSYISDLISTDSYTFLLNGTKHVQVVDGKELLLTPKVREHFSIVRFSAKPSQRTAVIICEAHGSLPRQWEVYRGLEALFDANPWLAKKGETAFLTEAWPAREPLSLKKLIQANPRVDDNLVLRSLSSWLITGYIAFEWKHQLGIPLIGHEDMMLYRLSNYLHWGVHAKRWSGKDEKMARILRGLSVETRNYSIGNTFLWALENYHCPILFVGDGHVGPNEKKDKQWRTTKTLKEEYPGTRWDDFLKFATIDELNRICNTNGRSIVSRLDDNNIGYILLVPRYIFDLPQSAARDSLPEKLKKNYAAVRKEQNDRNYGVTLQDPVTCTEVSKDDRSCCTVMPDPDSLADALPSFPKCNLADQLPKEEQELQELQKSQNEHKKTFRSLLAKLWPQKQVIEIKTGRIASTKSPTGEVYECKLYTGIEEETTLLFDKDGKLFRGIRDLEPSVVFEEGMNAKGNNLNLHDHVVAKPNEDGTASKDDGFVATSKDFSIAKKFGFGHDTNKPFYVYVIDADFAKSYGYDVNKTFPKKDCQIQTRYEHEVAFVGHIPPQYIEYGLRFENRADQNPKCFNNKKYRPFKKEKDRVISMRFTEDN